MMTCLQDMLCSSGTKLVGVTNQSDWSQAPFHETEPIPHTAWVAKHLRLD